MQRKLKYMSPIGTFAWTASIENLHEAGAKGDAEGLSLGKFAFMKDNRKN